MINLAVFLLATSLVGLEALLVFMAGTSGMPALALSVIPLVSGTVGIILLFRRSSSARGFSESDGQADSNNAGSTKTEKLSMPGIGIQPEKTENPARSSDENSIQEIQVYGKAIPPLFQSIVDYLNKTTEPMSASLFNIKTNMKDFIAQVQEQDKEIISSNTLDLMTGNVSRLQVSINQVAQNAISAFSGFEKEVKNLKEVLHSIFRLTGDISEIAERVHILSINASIESARAGVHGRGFKVIADEIQKLSRETQTFLKDIKLTAGTSGKIFAVVDQELASNTNNLKTMVQTEKDTFDRLNETITGHYGQFKNMYSGIVQFIDGLEGNMTELFPISMLHAIIIQEVENLNLVIGDFLEMLKEQNAKGPGSESGFSAMASIERMRKRLTTSRELDALEKAVTDLGFGAKIDLKRSTNDFELF